MTAWEQSSLAALDADVTMARVPVSEVKPLLLTYHYAAVMPSVSAAFALYEDGELEGAVTYGTPPSPPLREGIAGPEWASYVVELNRLCMKSNRPNRASMLVGWSLRQLPRPAIVVSFADTAQGHVGIVYQATNFLYTGLSADRTDWHVEGLEAHGITIADKFRNTEGRRADAVRAEYGDRFSLQRRSRKHRYVRLLGSKSERARMRADLRYPVVPYPKPS